MIKIIITLDGKEYVTRMFSEAGEIHRYIQECNPEELVLLRGDCGYPDISLTKASILKGVMTIQENNIGDFIRNLTPMVRAIDNVTDLDDVRHAAMQLSSLTEGYAHKHRRHKVLPYNVPTTSALSSETSEPEPQ